MSERRLTGLNLQKESQALSSITVQPDRTDLGEIGSGVTGREEVRRINIGGEFEVTVKNTGILPVFNASVHIDSLDIAGVTVVENKTESLATMTGGQTSTATFTFDHTTNETSTVNTMRSFCSGETDEISIDLKGSTGGFVMGTSIDSGGTIEPGNISCSLPSVDEPDDREDDGTGEDGDSDSGGDGEDDGGNGGGQADADLVIEGPDEPTAREEVEYTVVNEGEPFNASTDYYWYADGEQISQFNQTIQWTFSENEVGSVEIQCEVRDAWNDETVLGTTEKTVEVQEPEESYNVRIEGPTTVEVGESGEYEITADGIDFRTSDRYDWKVDGDMVSESTSTYNHTFMLADAEQDVNISCEVFRSDERIGAAETDVFVESDSDSSRGDIEGPDTVNVGEENTYTYSKDRDEYDAWDVDYEWYADGDFETRGREANIQFDESGTKTVRCVVRDGWNGNQIDQGTMEVEVNSQSASTLRNRLDQSGLTREHRLPSMSEAADHKRE